MKRSMVIRVTWAIGALALMSLLVGCPPSPPPTPTPTPTSTSSGSELGVVVKLADSHPVADPAKPELSCSRGSDHVRWTNGSSKDFTITFSVDWPFMEPKADIVVAAGATSPWYTLDPAKVASGGRPFPYAVTPTPSGPPDEPEISGQP